jgi:hypothetical protein
MYIGWVHVARTRTLNDERAGGNIRSEKWRGMHGRPFERRELGLKTPTHRGLRRSAEGRISNQKKSAHTAAGTGDVGGR